MKKLSVIPAGDTVVTSGNTTNMVKVSSTYIYIYIYITYTITAYIIYIYIYIIYNFIIMHIAYTEESPCSI